MTPLTASSVDQRLSNSNEIVVVRGMHVAIRQFLQTVRPRSLHR